MQTPKGLHSRACHEVASPTFDFFLKNSLFPRSRLYVAEVAPFKDTQVTSLVAHDRRQRTVDVERGSNVVLRIIHVEDTELAALHT